MEKAELHEGQQIFVIATISGGQPKQWRRFKNFHDSDYCCLERDHLDAVIFKPKRDIVFYGYGVFSSYYKRDITIKCGWEIDDERSEMHEITFVEADKSEKNTFDFLLTDVGEKPIKVKEGSSIHVLM